MTCWRDDTKTLQNPTRWSWKIYEDQSRRVILREKGSCNVGGSEPWEQFQNISKNTQKFYDIKRSYQANFKNAEGFLLVMVNIYRKNSSGRLRENENSSNNNNYNNNNNNDVNNNNINNNKKIITIIILIIIIIIIIIIILIIILIIIIIIIIINV